MFRYKNLPLAFAFQIIWCLTWTFMIYLFGYKGFIFMIVGAIRPLVFKMEPVSDYETHWKQNYLTLLYSVITFAGIIILLYIIDIFLLPVEFVIVNKPNIFLSLIPIFFLVHGIIGFINLYANRRA